MKRLDNLYDKMISYRNVDYVFKRVRNNCHNKEKVFDFIKYKNCNIIEILERLKNNNYSFSRYNIFLIKEKKYRIIMSENISDKIVNQMISYFILLPAFRNLIDTNVATRKGKGTSYAYDMVERYIRGIGLDKEIYVLKIDISKYFYNIDHEILFSMIKKRIKDEKALNIILQIISLTDYDYINEKIKRLVNNEIIRVKKLKISNEEKLKKIKELNSIPLYDKGRGISIGCLSNQMLALFYLNGIDHFVKEKLKHKYYVRYQDDLCIFDTDKEKLKKSFVLIEEELRKLKLKINNKSGIYRLKEGISFLGYNYQLRNNKLLIKYTNTTIRKINRKLRKSYDDDFDFYYRSINSYKGYFKKCNTNLYYAKYKRIEINSLFDKYKMLKGRYKDRVVFIKYKNRYYTYLEDLKEVNRILGKDYSSLSYNNFVKVIKDIDEYVILSGNRVI